MNIKLYDKVLCQVETKSSGKKAVFGRVLSESEQIKLEDKEFEVIGISEPYPEAEYQVYTILLEEDMLGWEINKFHVENQEIDIKFLGKKFWEITEFCIKEKKE